MPENPTTALAKTAQSPALARVSNQLALTDKLLTKSKRIRPNEFIKLSYNKQNKEFQGITTGNAQRLVQLFYRQSANSERLIRLVEKWENQPSALQNDNLATLKQMIVQNEAQLQQFKQKLQNNPITKILLKNLLK